MDMDNITLDEDELSKTQIINSDDSLVSHKRKREAEDGSSEDAIENQVICGEALFVDLAIAWLNKNGFTILKKEASKREQIAPVLLSHKKVNRFCGQK